MGYLGEEEIRRFLHEVFGDDYLQSTEAEILEVIMYIFEGGDTVDNLLSLPEHKTGKFFLGAN